MIQERGEAGGGGGGENEYINKWTGNGGGGGGGYIHFQHSPKRDRSVAKRGVW